MSEPTFKELKAQLDVLNQRIASQRARELTEAIATCKELIELFGLTAFDLGLIRTQQIPPRRSAPRTFRPLAPRSAVPPKYRDPATGETWNGRGQPPAWIAVADDRDAYLIA
ncbi:H-NS histone family protein [Paraburkholderia bannensis]|uniref:H-NS histone family protein n=1 Tax=Paraburkholderia bannensis TaxID=765414 RepID=UPI002AC32848|nr:H-NS histone family protein [Paraburkholderia bannensis]